MINLHGLRFKERCCFVSGYDFENNIIRLVKRYTRFVYRNVRVPCVNVSTGLTEIDILFVKDKDVFVVEAKRVREILGDYGGKRWKLRKNSNSYPLYYYADNVIVQNNIHASALADLYYKTYKDTIVVEPIIVVPNECEFPNRLSDEVIRFDAFEQALRGMTRNGSKGAGSMIGYRIDSILASCDNGKRVY